jgi:hypothetical protein
MRGVCNLPVSDPIGGISSACTLVLALTSAMSSLKIFGREKIVFIRETESGLSTLCYFVAKDLSTLPSIILAPVIFMSMFYALIAP